MKNKFGNISKVTFKLPENIFVGRKIHAIG
jgi:hypothetical protein